MRNKSIDFEKLAAELDISPTMHKYAVDRYNGISAYLESQGISAEFSPQGSFRTGTVTRPIKGGIESDFDIDTVCKISKKKDDTSPAIIKSSVGDALKHCDTYLKKLLPEDDRCWTLKYADVTNGVGLNLDVVPAVADTNSQISKLIIKGVQPAYAREAVSITEKKANQEYEWVSSNPKGFGEWFDSINARFLTVNLYENKKRIFQENRLLFSAVSNIEDVPDYYVKSSLQRVIQLLKRHRDLYFERIENGDNLRPGSIIITSLSAKIASQATTVELSELLSFVVHGLKDYSLLLQGKRPLVRFDGEARNYIDKRDQKWWIPNPVNPDDNYADSWTDETAKAFFLWVDTVGMDLSDISVDNESRYMAGLQASLGKEFVFNALSLNTQSITAKIAKPLTHPTKPWGMNLK